MLRGLGKFLSMERPEHHSIGRLKEGGVEKGSSRHSTLQGRERSVFFALLYFYFCLPLIPLGASWEERDVCLLHVGMPGQEGCCTEIVSL